MEHLSLEIFDQSGNGSKFAVLPDDTTITITDTSEIFASGDIWSHAFTLNVFINAHIFGAAGDIHGSRLHDIIHKRKARLWAEGLPLYLGYLKLDDESEIDENGDVDVTFESGQKTFEEMIEGAKANQVPMMSSVRFGVALWRKRWALVRLKLEASAEFVGGKTSQAGIVTHTHHVTEIGDDNDELTPFMSDGEEELTSVQQYPRMVFPKGDFKSLSTGEDVSVNELNTDHPYTEDEDGTPTHPFCNVALCYQKYGYTKTDEHGNQTTDYSAEPEAQRGYEYMPANRVNSAPNFFVLYWLRCLMKHLGIYVEENQMLDVEDLRRLFFVNTNCAYKEPNKMRTPGFDTNLKRYRFLTSKNYLPEYFGEKTEDGYDGIKKLIKVDDCSFVAEIVSQSPWIERSGTEFEKDRTSEVPTIKRLNIAVKEVAAMSDLVKEYYDRNNSYLHDAIATSDCFPNTDISEVIKAIESGFGVRLLFSDDFLRVRIVLLRNIFRSQEVQEVSCKIVGEDVKVENSKRGFRMTYGDSDDTHFYYKGFADKLPHKKPYFVDDSDKHDYSYWDLNADYKKLLNKVSAFDKTCYVTPNTGNAYGIKIDKDAKRYRELRPSLFGYADFMDAEDGDCAGEEETIETINVGFVPAIMNDLNMEQERKGNYDQRFALFVDEAMRPRREDLGDLPNENQPGVKSYDDSNAVYDIGTMYAKVGPSSDNKKTSGEGIVAPGNFSITSDMFAVMNNLNVSLKYRYWTQEYDPDPEVGTYWEQHNVTSSLIINIDGSINEGYRLYLQDNYEPNDDGIAPIETHDWGLTLGIMRGSGSDAYVNYIADPDDGEENETWNVVAGSSVTAHPDTCDNHGNLWNYDIEGGRRELALYLQNAGWSVMVAADGKASCTYHFILNGIDFLCTPIKYTRPGARPDWNPVLTRAELEVYVTDLWNQYGWNFGEYDWWKIVLSAKSTNGNTTYADGRFSLKLRAEKPNPYFNPALPESATNHRYLEIITPSLRRRGLADQFYKEYSYWIRNARIVRRTVRMELAQLLTIDKTKRVTVGDVTGFIRKMQYSVSNQTGLGDVTMEIMYI